MFSLRKCHPKIVHICLAAAGCISIFGTIFFALFHTFETILYDSISDINQEFVSQIDSLTETINASIVSYGMQLFYSDSAKILMGSQSFSNTDRVYMIRDLNTSLSSTTFAESIDIYNGYNGHVYSTNPSFPDSALDSYHNSILKDLFQNRDNEQRFKPIYCQDSAGRDYYAFSFYEVYPDDIPKPSALMITINADWYRKLLLASNPSSDLIVIDQNQDVLAAANDQLLKKYPEYYAQISASPHGSYIVNPEKTEICMFYASATTGHTYMRISSIKDALPRLFYFRKMVMYMISGLLAVFGMILTALLIFALLPMLKMKAAINTIDTLLDGDASPSLPLKEQLESVVTKSERSALEQLLYDMLTEKLEPDPSRLFKDTNVDFNHSEKSYGLMLILAHHRREIYETAEPLYPELLVAKSSHIYACIAIYDSLEDFHTLADHISRRLSCRIFISSLFQDFHELVKHFNNLDELHKLKLVIPTDRMLVHEASLAQKISDNTITTKDFTDLIVRLKSGNLESSLAKWQEMLDIISHYRYDAFQYILYRAEDTVCNIRNEFHAGAKLLPESLEQIQNLDEINLAFHQAFIQICDNYSEKKAQKYTELAEQVKNLVQNNYHDSTLNSQNIADRLQMNNAYLGRLFRNSYGRSINDYITTCRLEESMELLRKSDQPIQDIAQAVGFANIKYYYVLFKKHTGCTPAAYRAEG